MNLMKVLVVALVAGFVLAAVPGQAEEANIFTLKCTPDFYVPSFGKRPQTMWFTFDLDKMTVKSWTHNKLVGESGIPYQERLSNQTYLDVTENFLVVGIGWIQNIKISRITAEWHCNSIARDVLGICNKMLPPSGQRMELDPREYKF